MPSDEPNQGNSPQPRAAGDAVRRDVAWRLRDGSCVLLDAEVAARIPPRTFTIFRAGCGLRRPQIAERGRPRGEADTAPLARVIMHAQRGEWVLHINGNVMDCRRSNMRLVRSRAEAGGRLKQLQDMAELERAERARRGGG